MKQIKLNGETQLTDVNWEMLLFSFRHTCTILTLNECSCKPSWCNKQTQSWKWRNVIDTWVNWSDCVKNNPLLLDGTDRVQSWSYSKETIERINGEQWMNRKSFSASKSLRQKSWGTVANRG